MGTDDHARLAADTWRVMFDLLIRSRPERDAVLAHLGLTANEYKALHSLNAEDGRTMKELAAEWQCDASTATWTVDRLQRLDLAERRVHPTDRRARLVVLTPQGARMRAELIRAMYAPPAEVLALDDAQLRALSAAVSPLRHDRHMDSGTVTA
ncbi:MarR family winged helix-turn-helix transcriptional regulator [Jiangella alkaliphila]|uniref:DNA-binding transcriptional regulator, MarR family n=1 Tax=Jiangella alkaliphila TaxID=419479 RepID=A0A1H2JIP2_9ACTN|nr:MarR family transcriptional regulator [Jiangella alkaliphila]SDU55976.1 DNA-binding transcriptional regulator, MarR family [Jiangella alkaliphila]